MEAKGVFTVGKNAMIPHDDRGREIMAALSTGDRVLVKVHRARNPEHHRLAWAVFQRIGNSVGEPAEKVLLWLKVATGRVDFERMPNGKVIGLPRSTKFESMSQGEFQEFWNDAWPVITEQILPGLPRAELDELRAIVGPKNVPSPSLAPAQQEPERVNG